MFFIMLKFKAGGPATMSLNRTYIVMHAEIRTFINVKQVSVIVKMTMYAYKVIPIKHTI